LAGSLGAIPFAPLARFTCRCSLPDDPTARDLVAVTDTGHALSPEPIPKALPRHDEPVLREDGPSRILRLRYSVQHRRTKQVPTADGQIDQFFDLRQGARLVLELVVGRPKLGCPSVGVADPFSDGGADSLRQRRRVLAGGCPLRWAMTLDPVLDTRKRLRGASLLHSSDHAGTG